MPKTVVGAYRGSAENMLAVFNSEVLEIAQPGVDAFEGFVGRCGGIDASLTSKAGPPRRFHDQSRKPLAPAPIESVGLRIFIDQ